jgi:hypothetical protein
VVRQDVAVGLLRLAVVVVPHLPLAVFDAVVAAVVDRTTIAPTVQPPATRPFEHRGNHR